MAYILAILLTITGVSLVSLYIGIWGSVLDSFSDEKIRNDLLTASRLTEYEQARFPHSNEELSTLSLFKQAEKLSQRQREVFKDILNESHRQLVWKLILLFIFIGWGTIYLSHKLAGPLYRFQVGLKQIKEGNLSARMKLRKFDEGQFISETFNQAVEKIDGSFSRLKKIVTSNESQPQQMTPLLKEELSKIKTSAD
jgi:methyl-accepting chemotaxis protein